ncbi:hypothetical protein AB833_04905 [Chromatiales bacterium (ex Bugula neritina AB1)]|nr:hypothetical protein AB833_04905 [Chromatiales bacterium (ex Bugula neritina AB1)]
MVVVEISIIPLSQSVVSITVSNTGDFNRARVFEVIHLFEPISRTEVAGRLNLTAASVSNIVSELLHRGYIKELGRRSASRGQPAIELGVRADAAYTIGLHFEHGGVVGIVADLKGTVLDQQQVNLSPMPSSESVLDVLTAMGTQLIQNVAFEKIIGVGLATVGPIDLRSGSVKGSEVATGWSSITLREPLAKAFGLPVFMDNNATAGAIGEYWYGVGRAYRNFLYVGFFNMGLGGGLVLNKRVYRGSALNAAEFGHMLVHLDSLRPGIPPFLEHVVSGHALCRDFGEHILETFEQRMIDQDPLLTKWLDDASQAFANALVSVDHLLDLDTIIVGGQLPPAFFTALLTRVEQRLDALYMDGWLRRSTLQLGQTGLDSAVMGAATLPIYDAFSPDSSTGKITEINFRPSNAGEPMY